MEGKGLEALLGLLKERLRRLSEEDLVAISKGIIKLCAPNERFERELCDKIKLVAHVMIKTCEKLEEEFK